MDSHRDITIVWEHNPDLFTNVTIAGIRRRYHELLRLVTANPAAPLQTIFAQLSDAELQWRLEQQSGARASLRSVKRRAVQVAP